MMCLQANVVGRQCDRCAREAFGSLDGDDPPGCTGCFCFDRTSRCRQASYIWSEVSQLMCWLLLLILLVGLSSSRLGELRTAKEDSRE